MAREAVEKKLYDAASKGGIVTLEELLQGDPYLLHGVPFSGSRNLLHVATMYGQVGIAEEVMRRNPRLSRILDSQKLSPLHIAATEGHVRIAMVLLSISPEMRWWRDNQGMNPVHTAAMYGHVEVLEELIREDYLPATERLHHRQTVLHLCVKHRQVRAFEVLVEKVGDLVYAEDEDGETALHWAIRSNQPEIVRKLVEGIKMDTQSKNSMGKTALQILKESPRTDTHQEMREILESVESIFGLPSEKSMLEYIARKSDQTLVIMVLIAAMAFQVAVAPPGGFWQDNTSSHRAGKAVVASAHPKMYKHFVGANTAAFVSSLITIFFLMFIPLPIIKNAFIAMTVVLSTLASIGWSYASSVLVITPNTNRQTVFDIVKTVIAVSTTLILLGILWVAFRRLRSWGRNRNEARRS